MKKECFNDYLEYVKFMVDSGNRTRHLWIPNRGDRRYMYDAGNQRLCRHEKSARHRYFQEKEKTPTSEMNIFLPKKISTERINSDAFIVKSTSEWRSVISDKIFIISFLLFFYSIMALLRDFSIVDPSKH